MYIEAINHWEYSSILVIAEALKLSKPVSGNPWCNDWMCEAAPVIEFSGSDSIIVWNGSEEHAVLMRLELPAMTNVII